MFESINSEEFKRLLNSSNGNNLEIVDVREENEYKVVRLKNSKLIPMGEVMNNLDKINWDKKVILVCRSGSRSGYIAQMLSNKGKKVINLSGGINFLELNNCDCLEK